MTVNDVITELKAHGSESVKKIWLNHGIKEPFFGVKIEYLKGIQKKVKKNHALALGLFATGNADAMYLAALIADDAAMTKEDLQCWVRAALSQNMNEYAVPWVAAGSKHGYALALEWIDAVEEHIQTAGWATLAGIVSMTPDTSLDLPALRGLLDRAAASIHGAANRVRYTMNGFVIAVGSYVAPLTAEAMATGRKMGVVTVNMSGTACKVPDAAAYITKVSEKGKLGVKKKGVKC